ncbi:hypothetical protein ACM01_08060 [Streptomyces viridochromogenes]|uniref:Uncharacterized protein n=1 Tax=Streptomyces viridochromogenes TaxID=1938 RepID=A0A0J7ZKP8_STRVR|nr:hypothetical protein ACM01_08060 [Streptomyces viridochromogenes]
MVAHIHRATEIDRHTVGAAGDDLPRAAIGVQFADSAAGVAGDEHTVVGVEGRIVESHQTARDKCAGAAVQVDPGHEALHSPGQDLHDTALVEADRDRRLHILGDHLGHTTVR